MLTLDKIYHAAFVLKDVARKTDLIEAPKLSKDCQLYLKTENLQATGSFKVRGAYYKISQLSEEESAKGVIACSAGNHAQGVALAAQKEGISAELIDLRTIVPLDTETIIRSVKKTGKLLIVDEGHLSFGITGEIASRIMPDVFYDLDAPIQRMGTADVPLPFSPALEFPLIPDEKKIAAKIREMV